MCVRLTNGDKEFVEESDDVDVTFGDLLAVKQAVEVFDVVVVNEDVLVAV